MLLIVAAMIVVPVALVREGLPPVPTPRGLIIIAGLGLIPTAAANLLRVMVIRSAGPVFMSLTNYQVPLWSVLLGALVLSEPLPSSLMLAMVLILSGVCISQLGALRRLFGRKTALADGAFDRVHDTVHSPFHQRGVFRLGHHTDQRHGPTFADQQPALTVQLLLGPTKSRFGLTARPAAFAPAHSVRSSKVAEPV